LLSTTESDSSVHRSGSFLFPWCYSFGITHTSFGTCGVADRNQVAQVLLQKYATLRAARGLKSRMTFALVDHAFHPIFRQSFLRQSNVLPYAHPCRYMSGVINRVPFMKGRDGTLKPTPKRGAFILRLRRGCPPVCHCGRLFDVCGIRVDPSQGHYRPAFFKREDSLTVRNSPVPSQFFAGLESLPRVLASHLRMMLSSLWTWTEFSLRGRYWFCVQIYGKLTVKLSPERAARCCQS